MCNCVDSKSLYSLLALEADSFGAEYRKVLEQAFSKRSGGLEFQKIASENLSSVPVDSSDSELILGVDFANVQIAKQPSLV